MMLTLATGLITRTAKQRRVSDKDPAAYREEVYKGTAARFVSCSLAEKKNGFQLRFGRLIVTKIRNQFLNRLGIADAFNEVIYC